MGGGEVQTSRSLNFWSKRPQALEFLIKISMEEEPKI